MPSAFPQKSVSLCTSYSRKNHHQSSLLGPSYLASSKRFSSSTEEYTITKKSKITTTTLQFPFKESFSNRFYTIRQVLDANPYETVDIKVKISTKSENKQAIVHGERTMYKADCIVANETNSVKLVLCLLWEEAIDKVNAEKSYHIENCKIKFFDGSKFVNTNEVTKITQINEIPNVNLTTPQLHMHDYLVTGTCINWY